MEGFPNGTMEVKYKFLEKDADGVLTVPGGMAAVLRDTAGDVANIATLVWCVDMTVCKPVLAKAVFSTFVWSLRQLFPKSLALNVRLGKSILDAMNTTVSLCIGSAVPKKCITRLEPRIQGEEDQADQRWLWVDQMHTKDRRRCRLTATDCLVKYGCTKSNARVPSGPVQFSPYHTMR